MRADVLLSVFIKHLNYNLPAMIVMIIGLVWTIRSWRQHPPAARWALAAFIWMILTYLLAICWYSFGILFLLHHEIPLDEQTPYIMGLSCCEGVGYLLFILALNAARYPYRPPKYYDHYPEDDEPLPPSDERITDAQSRPAGPRFFVPPVGPRSGAGEAGDRD